MYGPDTAAAHTLPMHAWGHKSILQPYIAVLSAKGGIGVLQVICSGVQDALPHTAVGYLYVSEHHFVGRPGLKNAMRASIRANRLCAPSCCQSRARQLLVY